MKRIANIFYSASTVLVLTAFFLSIGSFDLEANPGDLYSGQLNKNEIDKFTSAGGTPTVFVSGFFADALAFDVGGNLFVADVTDQKIKKVTPGGVTTDFATIGNPMGLAFDGSGNLFVSDASTGSIIKLTPTGGSSTPPGFSGLNGPFGLAFDRNGNLFVSEANTGTISKITPTGTKTTFASGLSSPEGLAFDSVGNLYEVDFSSGKVFKFTPGGVKSTFTTGLLSPRNIAIDQNDNVFVANFSTQEILKFTPNATKTTFASNTNAGGLAFEPAVQAATGDLFEADQGTNSIFRFTPAGTQNAFATALGAPIGLAIDVSGNVFEADFNDGMIFKFTPAGVKTTFASGLNGPIALAFDAAGNLFAADSVAQTIFKFTPAGAKTTFASGLSMPVALAFDASGNLYEADHGTNRILKFAPGGGTPTVFASGLHGPFGLAFNAGNLFESDTGTGTIIKITSAGVKSNFATGLHTPIGLAFDVSGNLFEADQASGTIFKFTPDGVKSLFVSGLSAPSGLAFEAPPAASLRFETESLKVQSKTPPPSGVSPAQWSGTFTASAASGGAGTYFNANAVGNYITYTLPVAKLGTYQVRVGTQSKPNKGIFQLSINGAKQGFPVDEYARSLSYGVVNLGNVTFTNAGDQSFTFTVKGKNAASTGYTLAFDYIELIPTNRQETESLKVQSITPVPAGVGSAQWFGVFSAAAASGGAATYFNANAIGNYITYTVPVPKAGTYRILAGIQTKPNKGIFQLAINGLNIGQPQDEYYPSVSYVMRDLGLASFSFSGNYAFKFTVTSKNVSSSGYTLAFDYIELVPE